MSDPDLKQQTMRDVAGAVRLYIAYVGMTNGLFDALSAGAKTSAALAEATGRDPGYVERWWS